ncbi:MAG: multifunctional CCA tRNA nucleotidyl transferase/2'3'-cyclic phosphodiesterase/2'nucleotidase/phosphatase [Chromatiaceae bacterium]
MRAYLVGGYVRDRLLGLNPADRDWVVVGETADSMLARGYKMAGKGFPVFLHPQTGEVYALARTDRDRGERHADRTVFAAPDVSLEDDLARRDLTLNAMAMTADGALIDPFGGARDLAQGVLRHVGPGFRDDPVRVLRVARFAARFGFTIAAETRALIGDMVAAGELDTMIPERVWNELDKALGGPHPDEFIRTLFGLGALAQVMPRIDQLMHDTHRDGLLAALAAAAERSDDPLVRFGVLVCRLGMDGPGQDDAAAAVDALGKHIAAPVRFRRFGRACAAYRDAVLILDRLDPATAVSLFTGIGALKRPADFDRFLLVCEADAVGRGETPDDAASRSRQLRRLLAAVAAVPTAAVGAAGLSGQAFGERLRTLQTEAVRQAMAPQNARTK